ncbi:alpha/beta hydrolase [Streptomyces sulphureus]|uniref:alpha/beta hydrolase n=1 Tax=Streptomyces sulphureus TaxID=47758 RepID=UPI000365B208|nr:alpha/beta fold hydrolase [Streptomyces sulphureus]
MRSPDREQAERFEVASVDGTLLRGFSRAARGSSDARGEPETLVLLHGVAMDHRVWSESSFLDALPDDVHVVAPDLRGRGESDPGHSAEGHAIDRYVEDVRAVLGFFGRERYSLFGLYFGGRIALRVAEADRRVQRAFSFCAHGEAVEVPADAVEEEAKEIEGPGGYAYLRDHFSAAGAPAWMVSACDRVDQDELAAATRGLLHGSHQRAERGAADQDLVLITAEGDADLGTFREGSARLGARLWLVDSRTRVRAAARLAEVGTRTAELLTAAPAAMRGDA